MNNNKPMKIFLSAFLLSAMSLTVFAQPFKAVKIGRQTWMTENLNVDKFRNGDVIPQAKTDEEWVKAGESEQPAWCYYENDPANGTKYGKLYNFYAVRDPRGLAPSGYHIPTADEWTTLTDFLGDYGGDKIKSESGWHKNGNGNNSTGFSGLPGGIRDHNGKFNTDRIGEFGYWWSSSENGPRFSWHVNLYYYIGVLSKTDATRGSGFSVRCLKD